MQQIIHHIGLICNSIENIFSRIEYFYFNAGPHCVAAYCYFLK